MITTVARGLEPFYDAVRAERDPGYADAFIASAEACQINTCDPCWVRFGFITDAVLVDACCAESFCRRHARELRVSGRTLADHEWIRS